MERTRRAVVLGGYGLIGAACTRALLAAGWHVTGIGRSVRSGQRAAPGADWLARDLARQTVADWRRDLQGVDVVVNAAGALQDSAREDLTAIHETLVARLAEALAGSTTRIVQISAAGVSSDAPTGFFRSKARGDALLAASGLDHVILRPALVLGAEAWGGTALLRALAATPVLRPKVMDDSPVQTVSLDDVARAVVAAAEGRVPTGTIADLAEPDRHRLADVAQALRGWHGWPAWRIGLPVPAPLLATVARIADGLGWLGWRPPVRSTALAVLRDGITADPGPWRAAGGPDCRPLHDTLAARPATLQDRWFARLYLLFPLILGTLALFWIASGVVALLNPDAARTVLTSRGFSDMAASGTVIGGALADIGLGLALLYRPTARAAALGMVALSLAYLGGATLWATDLWADPAGPLVKVLPGIALALTAAALLEDR